MLLYLARPKFLAPPSWPIFETYLLLMEQFNFRTRYAKSIVKSTKKDLKPKWP